MHIWDIFENLMNTFLGIEGWGWGGGIGTMSKTKLKRIDTLKYHKCAVKKLFMKLWGNEFLITYN